MSMLGAGFWGVYSKLFELWNGVTSTANGIITSRQHLHERVLLFMLF